ncbi:SDR family NAD(P)-dependent oxidoreductase [Luteimonas aestuarii]|uniref:SDR family NAD(P)-dependent oxidoreductase n=1 Tax=Luteimonas aestuarii TaxID=453837 RepID=A0A4R5TSC9_9GAMM|nr:oxidoreductase [Luteimonas aestuarii]TDK23772.1 SDR family NAD(P)-dependent oxidoreductase [Luteimonas aestuarii]
MALPSIPAALPQHRRNGLVASSVRVVLLALALVSTAACSAGRTAAQGAPDPDWSLADMPAQDGRVVVVTGGTSGIGFESAKALAVAGAHVVIAARNAERGAEAVAAIHGEAPGAVVRFEPLDLADLASVRAFGRRLEASLPHIDVLVNNAGIMEPPQRGVSADGFEMQFATNYLGHFALTAELLPLLRKASSPRVVSLSSIAARLGTIHFDDLQFSQDYRPGPAYQQSKLACLMFALELQRRSDAAGWGIQSIASHPGVSRTNLQVNNGVVRRIVGRMILQPASRGALPTLYAATAPDAQGGRYYGPTGVMEFRGPLGLANVPAAATDATASARLWDMSEALGGVRFADAGH